MHEAVVSKVAAPAGRRGMACGDLNTALSETKPIASYFSSVLDPAIAMEAALTGACRNSHRAVVVSFQLCG